MGVLIFTHPESDLGIVERVPYMDENILCGDFEKALNNGCDPANIYPYVCFVRHTGRKPKLVDFAAVRYLAEHKIATVKDRGYFFIFQQKCVLFFK